MEQAPAHTERHTETETETERAREGGGGRESQTPVAERVSDSLVAEREMAGDGYAKLRQQDDDEDADERARAFAGCPNQRVC